MAPKVLAFSRRALLQHAPTKLSYEDKYKIVCRLLGPDTAASLTRRAKRDDKEDNERDAWRRGTCAGLTSQPIARRFRDPRCRHLGINDCNDRCQRLGTNDRCCESDSGQPLTIVIFQPVLSRFHSSFDMPEIRELYIFHHILRDFLEDCATHSRPLQVLQLWFDCKQSEITQGLVTDPSAVSGHIVPLTYKYSRLTRGSKATQTNLYPPPDIVPALEKCSTPLAFRQASMIFRDVILDPRFIILDLHSTILEIQVLQHCSPQIYDITDWKERICKVDRWVRKFKVSLALEFRDHVLVFGSYDNNTRVYWYSAEEYQARHWDYVPYIRQDGNSERLDLDAYLSGFNESLIATNPYIFVDPLAYYHGFLATIVWFIVVLRKRKQASLKKRETRRLMLKYLPTRSTNSGPDIKADKIQRPQGKQSQGSGSTKRKPSMLSSPYDDRLEDTPADILQDGANLEKVTIVQLLRRAGPFPTRGIGIYASEEILRKTGIPPLTPARDVFRSPSRTARLCEAIFAFLTYTQAPLAQLLGKSRHHHRFTLYSSRAEQIGYSAHLDVHGQARCFVTSREKSLLLQYEVRNLVTILEETLLIYPAQSSHNVASQTPFHPSKLRIDPFEPMCIKDALSIPGHLGHLVFGEKKWYDLYPDARAWPPPDDPLTRFYAYLAEHDRQFIDLDRHLDLAQYDTLESPVRSWVDTKLYKVGGDALWTLVHLHDQAPNTMRLKKTINFIKSHSDGWTVGPMDFCVIGMVFPFVAKSHLAICRGDPALSPSQRYALERMYDSRHRYPSGKRKRRIERKHRNQWHKLRIQASISLTKATMRLPNKGTVGVSSKKAASPLAVRKRRSADTQLIMEGSAKTLNPSRTLRSGIQQGFI
ncbi:hypothetical protein ARMSODRAFT_1018825 [Armillaria solidipes]|uniref:Uncharacterized protein n=1 Tax=Armillaria solidipes TaxID=1076256 RepID=A0A2H3BXT9_9AGAR|nr:hypothetical protein ARMSODRAFT_1018825 [Armillaria solidipes]